jgi:hypothetical protein
MNDNKCLEPGVTKPLLVLMSDRLGNIKELACLVAYNSLNKMLKQGMQRLERNNHTLIAENVPFETPISSNRLYPSPRPACPRGTGILFWSSNSLAFSAASNLPNAGLEQHRGPAWIVKTHV